MKYLKHAGLTVLFMLLTACSSNGQTSTNKQIAGTWLWDYNPQIGVRENTRAFYTIRDKGDSSYTVTFEGGPVNKRRRSMKGISFNGNEIRIDHELPNMYFKGVISNDGLSMKGLIIHHSSSDSLFMTKVAPSTLKPLKK